MIFQTIDLFICLQIYSFADTKIGLTGGIVGSSWNRVLAGNFCIPLPLSAALSFHLLISRCLKAKNYHEPRKEGDLNQEPR